LIVVRKASVLVMLIAKMSSPQVFELNSIEKPYEKKWPKQVLHFIHRHIYQCLYCYLHGLGMNSKQLEEQIERMRIDSDSSNSNTNSDEMARYKHGSNDVNVTNDSVNFSYDSNVPIYDIGKTRVTQFNPKAGKDTFYRFQSERDKRLGQTKPVSFVV